MTDIDAKFEARLRGPQPRVVVLDQIPNTSPTESDTPS